MNKKRVSTASILDVERNTKGQNMDKLIKNIEQWAIDRGIHKKGTINGQTLKSCEELAELIVAISKNDKELIKDGIGDVFVTFVIGNMLQSHEDMSEIYEIRKSYFDILFRSNERRKKKKEQIKSLAQILFIASDEVTYHKKMLHGVIKTLIETAEFYDLTLYECVEYAYSEIKDRKGKMIDGTFVKEL